MSLFGSVVFVVVIGTTVSVVKMIDNLYLRQLEQEISDGHKYGHVTASYNNALNMNNYEPDPLVRREQEEYIERIYSAYVLQLNGIKNEY